MAIRSSIKAFDYEDVRLIPNECQVRSRSEISVTQQFGNETFTLPLMPANMASVVDFSTCFWLAQRGYFYVMHRFDNDPVDLTQRFHDAGVYASISLGVQNEDFQTIERFASASFYPEYITIDVAHGDMAVVRKLITLIRKNLPHTFIIAGNVATAAAALRLEEAGAHAIKVGVGPGLACLSSPHTGFGTRGWQLSAVEEIALAVQSAQIIADGGIREPGDIAKALAFGADMVMIGGMLAGHDESPGETIVKDGVKVKAYYGSASAQQKGNTKHVEGKSMFVPYRGELATTLTALQEHLQSAVSYAGGKTLAALPQTEYVLLK